MEDLSLPGNLGEILTQQLLKTTSRKGDEFDYDCEFDEEFDRLNSAVRSKRRRMWRLEVMGSDFHSRNRTPRLINYDAKAFLPIP